MAASTYFAQVQQLYIAYFGRPADPTGQEYWAKNIDAANGSIASVIAGFSASAESAALFGNKSSIDKVTAIYQNAFGRAPEPAGLAYWVAQLDSGKVSQAQASWTIQQSAGPGDAAAVQNKLTAAQAFTAQIDTTAEIQGYQGSAAAESARAFLKTVTADNATATAAVNGAAAAVAAATSVGVVGTTFTLTAGIDNLTGDNGNNTFIGDANTISAADQINGGAGTDTLNIFDAGAAQVLPALNSVERLVLTNPAAQTNLDVTNVAGLTDVVLKGGDGSLVTVAAGTVVTFDGATAAAQGVDTTATATAATVGLTNGATVTALTVNGAAVKTLNIASNGSAANTITALDGTATAQAGSTLNVTGTQKLTVTGALATTFTTVNASTNTGGVSVAFGVNDVTVTGGAGNDSFNFAANLTVADKVDGGAGIDTVSVTGGAALTAAVVAGLNAVKSVETVEFNGTVAAGTNTTVTLGSAAGALSNAAVTKLLFNTTAAAPADAADVVNAADAAHTYAFGAANTGAATLNLATGVTSVNVGLEGGSALGALTVNPLAADLVATPTLVNTVNIASSGTAANTIAAVTAQAGSTVKVSGSQDLTITALTNKGTVDASAFTGKLAITGSTGADTIILGSGADKVTVGVAGSTYKVLDTITNFTKADTLALTGATVALATDLVKFDATNAVSFEQALVSAEAAIGSAKATWFNFGSDTYVLANTDAGNSVTATASGDLVVKLSGVVALVGDATGIHAAA